MTEYKYHAVTEKIIGASMKVHSSLGNGFQEVIYQRALAIELEEMYVRFERELDMPIITRAEELGKGEWTFSLKRKSWLN